MSSRRSLKILAALLVAGGVFCAAGPAALAATGLSGDSAGTYLTLTATGTEIMRLTATSVGIGTTAPGYKLDVAGTAQATGFTANMLTNGPPLNMYIAAGGADSKWWDFALAGTTLSIRALNDAYSAANSAMTITRSGYTISSTTFPQGNVGIGTTTLPQKLTVNGDVGLSALTNAVYINSNRVLALPAGGTGSLAVGAGALLNQSGSLRHNTAVGGFALASNYTGYENVAVGTSALYNNWDGIDNVAVGRSALQTTTTGSHNTAVGYGALWSSTMGYNTAVGDLAGQNLTSYSNTLLGYHAGNTITTGGSNIAIGANAASSTLTTGGGNILIGNSVTTPAAATNNHLNIGNTIYGDVASGLVGLGTAVPWVKLHVHAAEIGASRSGDATPYMRLGMDTGYVQYVANNAYWTGAAYNYVNTGGYGGLASRMAQVSGAVYFETANGGVDPITWNTRLYITNAGSVGIGTTSPASSLDVINYSRVLGSPGAAAGIPASGEGLEFTYDTTNHGAYIFPYNRTASAYQKLLIDGNPVIINYNSSTSSVGIGTSTPGATLDVNGPAKFGADATACSGSITGRIRWNSTRYEYCDGSAWSPFRLPDCADNSAIQCTLAATRSSSDPNFTAANIASGVNILGVVGSFVPSASTKTSVSMGAWNACSFLSDGSAWCWGKNGNGNVGDNTTTQRNAAVQVKGVGGSGTLTNVNQLKTGNTVTCATKADGSAWCWGYNGNGQIGDNTTTQRNAPVQVLGSGGVGTLTNVSEINAGSNNTCALKTDGSVWCWGFNISGQVGDTTTTQRLAPVQIIASGATDIDTEGDHSCAVKTDGSAWCWGNNFYGAIGDNTSGTNRLVPTQVKGPGGAGTLANVRQISCGTYFTCAAKTDNTAWCWGYNMQNQLGDNTTTQRNAPVQVLNTSGVAVTNVSDISAGGMHACVRKTDNTVWCWGYNLYGQLGDTTTTQRNGAVQSSITNASVMDAGGYQTCALKTDDTLWCWGSNSSGELGNGAGTGTSATPVPVVRSF